MDTAGVLIRTATLADVAEVAQLLTELGYPSSPDDVSRRFSAVLSHPDCCVVVAEADDIVCGVGALHAYPAIHRDGREALITALVVRSSVRGQGIGRLIVAELEAQARRLGCQRIMVTTANHRSGAHAFYERLGYGFTGRRYARPL